jgi:hypothetical protein
MLTRLQVSHSVAVVSTRSSPRQERSYFRLLTSHAVQRKLNLSASICLEETLQYRSNLCLFPLNFQSSSHIHNQPRIHTLHLTPAPWIHQYRQQ